MFVTVTDAVTGAVPSVAGVHSKPDSANVVYDSPNPNGNSGRMPRAWNQR